MAIDKLVYHALDGDRSLEWAQDTHATEVNGRIRIALSELGSLMILVHVSEKSGGVGIGRTMVFWSVLSGPDAAITVMVLDKSKQPRGECRVESSPQICRW